MLNAVKAPMIFRHLSHIFSIWVSDNTFSAPKLHHVAFLIKVSHRNKCICDLGRVLDLGELQLRASNTIRQVHNQFSDTSCTKTLFVCSSEKLGWNFCEVDQVISV